MTECRFNVYLVPMVDNLDWKKTLQYFLSAADTFIGYFPQDEQLGHGFQELSRAPGAVVGEWKGMKGSRKVTAPLSTYVKDFVLRREEASDNIESKLWSYALLREGQVILSVEDFTVCLVYLTGDDIRKIKEAGIDTTLWRKQEISYYGEERIEHSGIEQSDLQDIAGFVKEKFGLE